MLKLITQAALIDTFLHDLYFEADEDGGDRLFYGRPENRHRCADDSKIDLQGGNDDKGW